jgi:hypothetical protein
MNHSEGSTSRFCLCLGTCAHKGYCTVGEALTPMLASRTRLQLCSCCCHSSLRTSGHHSVQRISAQKHVAQAGMTGGCGARGADNKRRDLLHAAQAASEYPPTHHAAVSYHCTQETLGRPRPQCHHRASQCTYSTRRTAHGARNKHNLSGVPLQGCLLCRPSTAAGPQHLKTLKLS